MKGRIAVATASAVVVMLCLAAQALAKGTAYIPGGGTAGLVAAQSVGANGGLTPLGTVGAGNSPRSVAVTPDARHVYVSNAGGAGSISGYNVGASGALTPIAGPAAAAGAGAEGIAISPNGQFLYSASTVMVGGDSITGYSIDPATGALTPVPGSPVSVVSPNALAIAPDGTRLFATLDGGVRVFDIGATGALTANGGLVTAGTTPRAVAVTPDGQFLFVANLGDNNISRFSIGATGTLTPLGVTASAPNPSGLAIDQNGQFLYAANQTGPGTVNAFAIGPNGGLIPVPGQPFGATSNLSYGVDAAPNGRVYVSNNVASASPGTVTVFGVGANGALAQITGSPFPAGVNEPVFQSIAITPNQGPTAQFTGGTFQHRSTTTTTNRTAGFDATGSTDSDGGTIARYDWAFGDGSVLADGGPTPLHVYASEGSYQVTLRVTDDENCSTTTLFTGQTADCNGSSAAVSTQAIQVGADTVPDLTLTAKTSQKLKKTVTVKAQTIDTTNAVAKGKLMIQGPKKGRVARKAFKLKKDRELLEGGASETLSPKIPKKAFTLAKRALQSGGRVGAKVGVRVVDADGDADTAVVKVKLTKP